MPFVSINIVDRPKTIPEPPKEINGQPVIRWTFNGAKTPLLDEKWRLVGFANGYPFATARTECGGFYVCAIDGDSWRFTPVL